MSARGTTRVRRHSACAIAVALAACAAEPPPVGSLPPIASEWIEIHPRHEPRYTLTLHADSTASGTFFDPDAPGEPQRVTAWRVGAKGMPDGLCLKFGEIFSCQGWAVRGDTMFLANGSGTVLVRAAAFDPSVRYAPTAPLAAPVPGDTAYRRSRD